jgi:alcohol dehydrogenase class IV
MLPAFAVVDPELTYELPPEITAYTGLDALTQLIEPFLCSKANPLTDGICREALPRVARALPVAFRDGKNVAARRDMALGSLCGGLALANAGLGAVHGFAAPIGGMFDAPHGAVCAALLPAVMKVNLRAVIALEITGTLERFDELGRLLTSDEDANADHAVQAIENLCRELKVPSLQKYAVQVKDFDLLCERAAAASSMKANPVELDHEELYEILEWSL